MTDLHDNVEMKMEEEEVREDSWLAHDCCSDYSFFQFYPSHWTGIP